MYAKGKAITGLKHNLLAIWALSKGTPGGILPFMLKKASFTLILILGACTHLSRQTPEPTRGHQSYSNFTQSRAVSVSAALRDSALHLVWPIAHRGRDEGQYDNSLEGIKGTANLGVPLLEVDVRRNDSGTLFLFHDSKLNHRNAWIPDELFGRRIDSLNDAELASVLQLQNGRPHLPKLEEALEAIRGYNIALQLDIKSEKEEVLKAIVDAVVSKGQLAQVVFQSKYLGTARYIRTHAPQALIDIRCRSKRDVDEAIKLAPEIVELEGEINRESLSLLHQHGIKVLINVAGSPYDRPLVWKRLLDEGYDIIMTDRAREYLEFLKSYSVGE